MPPTTITGDTGVSQIQSGATSDGLPVFQCRAWVNFDGTRDSNGTLSTANTARLIRGSGNVSSVVRNGTGDYTVNFTTAMPDGNYSISLASDTDTDVVNNFSAAANPRLAYTQQSLNTTSSCRVFTGAAAPAGSVPLDFRAINLAVFR